MWSHTVRAVTERMADLGLSFDLIDFEAEVDKGFSHKFVDWCFFFIVIRGVKRFGRGVNLEGN